MNLQRKRTILQEKPALMVICNILSKDISAVLKYRQLLQDHAIFLQINQ